MNDDEEEVDLKEGMPVGNEDGESLGTLAALLVEEEEEEAEFLIVSAKDGERLVPFEAVLGVGDGTLVIDVPATALNAFPKIREGADPTDAEMELAYRVYEENASYEEAE